MARILTSEDIKDIMSYHQPTEAQLEKIQAIRDAAELFAHVICRNTPICADQAAAFRHVREAMMTANDAIALDGKV
jgi:hypothetical protein